MRVVVTGGTGFVGSHVVPELIRDGHDVVAVSRHGRAVSSWPPGVRPARADAETGEGLEAAMADADAVVHLVAIPRETGGRRFEAVNVRGTANVVAAAEHAGVGRFVHLGALGAVDDPKLGFLRSKWRGEQAVRSSRLRWTILRPSLLFGEGDGFFTLVKVTLTWWSPVFVAIPGDGSTRFQPLSVDDLAIAVARTLADERHAGQIHELGGPEYLTYRQIVERVMRATGRRRIPMSVPIPVISGITALADRVLPVFPVSHDQIASLRTDNYTALDAFERTYGISPRPLDLSYLR